ncbi:MAG: DUF4348 domain-containing protein [Saprospiraceae bacterium]|nr:DUF4348 domain-containing protein [Saprospiraceae bacterium]MCF8250086.1 DUF4348 domain-containing protein [Saprospiraceae bacterium]MCF8279548.1 DUF4348 domain-containing protein [Bacteroidales bacterium]MCF8311948.1 DUF4348 domain-containing protein [Saprospiraceae bacterium]MCF8440362.1 DUF4348 domain-containing protein [Saprospiraceae bacterium]
MKYLPIFILFVFFACKNTADKPTAASADSTETPELPAGFSDFYQKFHSDSVYQVEHIVWPLEGLPNNADSATVAAKTFRWMPEDWRMQHQFDFQVSEYKREIVPLTETIVMERIIHQSGQFGMIRRFAIIGGDWHLIYYAGVNRLIQ